MLNQFRNSEIISARTPEVLAEKIRALPMTFQIINVWSDGESHYALLNANKRFSAREKLALARVEEAQEDN